MNARLLLAAAAAACPIHAACAQESGSPNPARVVAEASGFRVEAMVGYDNDGYQDGMLYGGRIGYDVRVAPKLLLGVDGEYSDVTTDQDFAFPGLPSLTAEDGPEFYIGGRATFALSSRFRLYGGAGYTRTKEGYFFQSNPNPPPLGTVASGRRSVDGYRLSAGAQLLLGRHAFVGAEYRFSDYGRFALNRGQGVASIGFRF